MQGDALRISVREMLSSCVSASEAGCAAIVSVRESGKWSAVLKEKENARSALTEADLAAQRVMVQALRQTWGTGLKIVAEEDEALISSSSEESFDNSRIVLERDLFTKDETKDQEYDIAQYTIVIDPLDGTREFVEGRVHNVRVLIGIAVDSRAVAGVSAAPFLNQIIAADNTQWYRGTALKKRPDVFLAAGDGGYQTVRAARAFFRDETKVEIGGTGAKIEAVVLAQAGLAVIHAKTVAVDTCALEPIIRSASGRISDYFGSPLAPYSMENRPNNLGVIASHSSYAKEHDRLCLHLRSHPASLSLIPGLDQNVGNDMTHAVDIARRLDGQLLTIADIPLKDKIVAFGVPEKGAERGLMSQACRIIVRTNLGEEKSVFYKRVKFSELEYQKKKSKLKIERDARSYLIEASFLNSDKVQAAGIPIPQILGAPDMQPDFKHPLNSKYALFLTDFSPANKWYQRDLLDFEHAAAALEALAKFHAAFWNQDIDAEVWPHGAYFEPEKQDPDALRSIGGDAWQRHFNAFDGFSKQADFASLGDRLQPIAQDLAFSVHPREKTKQHTIIHGDPKAANIFFSSSSPLKVGLIDFQWTGYGRVGADIAHFLAASVEAPTLYQDESSLLDVYYSALCAHNSQIASSFSRADLQTDVENGILDTGRLVFGYQWLRLQATPAVLEKNANVLGRNAYNKNIQNAFWLVDRIHTLLLDRGL